MSDENFMRAAIKQGKKSLEPLKCGALIVKDGKIVSQAYNSQRKDCNATAHAEIKAIAAAGKKLNNKNLDNCILYSTCEPCTMCLSAIIFSNIKKLFYGISERDTNRARIDITTKYLFSKSPHYPEVIRNFLEDECKELLVELSELR